MTPATSTPLPVPARPNRTTPYRALPALLLSLPVLGVLVVGGCNATARPADPAATQQEDLQQAAQPQTTQIQTPQPQAARQDSAAPQPARLRMAQSSSGSTPPPAGFLGQGLTSPGDKPATPPNKPAPTAPPAAGLLGQGFGMADDTTPDTIAAYVRLSANASTDKVSGYILFARLGGMLDGFEAIQDIGGKRFYCPAVNGLVTVSSLKKVLDEELSTARLDGSLRRMRQLSLSQYTAALLAGMYPCRKGR